MKLTGTRGFYKKVLTIAVPIAIQNGITNFVSMLDNIMVGRVGTDAMSGVSIVNQLLFVFILCLFGATAGIGIFTAQFSGKGDNDGIRYTMRMKLLVSLFLVAAGICVFVFFGEELIGLWLQGDSGTGKTTVASIIAASTNRTLRRLNATTSGISDIRNIISRRVERGKIDFSLLFQDEQTSDKPSAINWNVANEYINQYVENIGILGQYNQIPHEVIAAILRFPDVTKSQEDNTDLSEEEWTAVQDLINAAIDGFVAFRTQEGAALQAMFTEKLDGIADLLAQVEPFEKGRVAKIKERLEANLAQLSAETQAQIDRNRLEQEMIYYLEKLDITEEKVRLTNHIKYFRETMDDNGSGVGKKLGFIAQEMGREINTLGSKSNQSEMQIIVVKMKDILEQIKEQVLNVL